MRKTVICIALIALLLLTASCKQQNDAGRGLDQTIEEFRKGTEGVELSFHDKLPPEKVGHRDATPVIVHVKNNGATDVEFGKVVLQSTTGNVQIFPESLDFDLRGKDALVPKGEETEVEFEMRTNGVGVGRTTLVGYSCYSYETLYVDSVCLDPHIDKAKNVAKQSCTPENLNPSGGQGGPVEIKHIEVVPRVIEEDVIYRFNITVGNARQGKIVPYTLDTSECLIGASTFRRQSSSLQVEVQLSNGRIRCDSQFVGLDEFTEDGNIVCTSGPIRRLAASKSPMQIILKYGYVSEPISKNVEILGS